MVVEKVEGCSWEGGSASIYIYWEGCGRGKELEPMKKDSPKKVRPAPGAAKRVKKGYTDWLAKTACFVR